MSAQPSPDSWQYGLHQQSSPADHDGSRLWEREHGFVIPKRGKTPEKTPLPPQPRSAAEAAPTRLVFCETRRTQSPQSTLSNHSSGRSLGETPPRSLTHRDLAAVSPAVPFERLSLDHDRPVSKVRNRTEQCATEGWPSKRIRTSPEADEAGFIHVIAPVHPRPQRGRGCKARRNGRLPAETSQPSTRRQITSSRAVKRDYFTQPARTDSGYVTRPSRDNTLSKEESNQLAGSGPEIREGSGKGAASSAQKPVDCDGLVPVPQSSSITQDQLIAEVKGIYSSLLIVEAKCKNIDAAQATDLTAMLDDFKQSQALIALHRTLLYEHHDFMMATQHPSATPGLRALAAKYNMPARMWKHGIHAFLEVLRHRRPESQDHMMSFIYLAYQMIALLYETVPAFQDTWVECLGDLARYRMAIEEDKEMHSSWGSVAARWYCLAADRHPATGRLNHHLGILEKPSLRKLFLYSKSLTAVIRFPNALDSLATLCAPIVKFDTIQKGAPSAEARIVTYHALVFTGADTADSNKIARDALMKLEKLPTPKLRELGVFVVLTNIAALFELGAQSNGLWQAYSDPEIKWENPSQHSSVITDPGSSSIGNSAPLIVTGFDASCVHSGAWAGMTGASPFMRDFSYKCFNALVGHRKGPTGLQDTLPSVHSLLVWFHSLHSLGLYVKTVPFFCLYKEFTSPGLFTWTLLSEYLNTLIDRHPTVRCCGIRDRMLDVRRTASVFGADAPDTRPLPEDYHIRGLIWARFYFPQGWFKHHVDEDERFIETGFTFELRVDRVLRLALFLAFHTSLLSFDSNTLKFSAPAANDSLWAVTAVPQSAEEHSRMEEQSLSFNTSFTSSANLDFTDEDYTIISPSEVRVEPAPSLDNITNMTPPNWSKSKQKDGPVSIAGVDAIE